MDCSPWQLGSNSTLTWLSLPQSVAAKVVDVRADVYRAGNPELLASYPAFARDPKGRVGFYWDSKFTGASPGRYIVDIYFSGAYCVSAKAILSRCVEVLGCESVTAETCGAETCAPVDCTADKSLPLWDTAAPPTPVDDCGAPSLTPCPVIADCSPTYPAEIVRVVGT